MSPLRPKSSQLRNEMMKPVMCLLALALAAAPAQALGRPAWPTGGVNAAAATDRVLVLGAPKALVHTNSAPAQRSKLTFSPAGLAELALDAMGLPTGHVAGAREASPLQADVFTHTQAYALVLVDSAVSTPVLQSIDTTGADSSFRHTYPLAAGWSDMIPSVIAREFKTGFGNDATVACAGSSAVCKHALQQPQSSDSEAELQQVLDENTYLDANNKADKAFAQELAQAKQLTKAVTNDQKAAHAFFVLGFSSVQALEAGATREAANTALAAQISEFLAAFQTAYTNSGVQIVAASGTAGPQKLPHEAHAKVLDDVMSYDRMLLSFGDLSGSGSDASDDGNSTTGNSTAAGQLSMEAIAEYQILLWTSVMLVVVLFVTIMAMVNMDVGRDSLLYAKFITDASHRKGD